MTDTLTFAHFSDPHLTSLRDVGAADLVSKRILGYLSWYISRRREHLLRVLETLRRDLAQTRPEHTVVTGDLTQVGLPGEFRQALQWLHALGSPRDVTVIPGNHDAYVKASWDETFSLWRPYMAGEENTAGQAPSLSGPLAFPTLRIRGPVAFIGLSSARPSAPFLAVGSLGEAQLRRLEKILEDTGRAGCCRVILIHHPPLPGTVKWRKRLTDARALQELLRRHGAELVLHGHTHRACRTELPTPHGTIPVFGVPSASAIGHKTGHGAQYYLYRVSRSPAGWALNLSIRGYAPDLDRCVAQGESRLTLERIPPSTPSPDQYNRAV